MKYILILLLSLSPILAQAENEASVVAEELVRIARSEEMLLDRVREYYNQGRERNKDVEEDMA